MFRARFSDALPKSLPHYGPQDIETGVQDTTPGEHVERLLCALIGLVLNRKKDVEYVTLRLLRIYSGCILGVGHLYLERRLTEVAI